MQNIISAEIISVGTELLLGDITNTNTAYLARRLAVLGITLYRQTVVGDNAARLTQALEEAYSRSNLVILTGGLGPTCDDITKETVANYFSLPMEEDAPTLEGELCYRDNAGAICRCWNWRDGVRTALSDDSEKAFLIIESVDPARSADLQAAIDELAKMMSEYLGANIFAKEIITRENPTMVIDE